MKIVDQYDQKKVDSLGRITIPVGLRRRFQIKENDMLDVFTVVDDNGREYVAVSKPIGSRAEDTAENSGSQKEN